MKIAKLLFAYVIFLLAFCFISYAIQARTNIANTFITIINPPPAYAQVVGCDGGTCYPSADACDASGGSPVAICDGSTGSMCCKAAPTCPNEDLSCGWNTPGNTCYNGNSVETCLHQNTNCSTYYYTKATQT